LAQEITCPNVFKIKITIDLHKYTALVRG